MPKPKHAQPSNHAVAQRSYHQRQLDRGLVRLSVYVPDTDRDAFWLAVDKLRDRWYKKGLID
jgi:hypothetical protein